MLPRDRKFGIVGGLGPLASADVFFKLAKVLHEALHEVTPALPSDVMPKSMPTTADPESVSDIVFEQHPFVGSARSDATTQRKLYIFDMLSRFEQQGVSTVVLPCFLSHTFIDELKANSPLDIVDIVEAVRSHIRRTFSSARRIGVLASEYTRHHGLFERYFPAPEFNILHPRQHDGVDLVTTAVYGDAGIRRGYLSDGPAVLLRAACQDLIDQGADIILPGLTEIALVADAIGALSIPMIDSNLAYAQYVVSGQHAAPVKTFKVGIVGGVGPAATVDFMNKIVRNTPASRDQDHIKLIVEQNPKIPDRTDNLIGDGADPTISLYATCKKLEAGDADLIAIPCNTAHAFVERIQPYLAIPIVNMLSVTVRYLRETFPLLRTVGLLATTGTVTSGIYEEALASQGLSQVVPNPALQANVMEAIFGHQGVKAGFTTGICQSQIMTAVDGFIAQGVEVVILGCTELPLLLPQGDFTGSNGGRVYLVDPSDLLAKRCVAYATSPLTESNEDEKIARERKRASRI